MTEQAHQPCSQCGRDCAEFREGVCVDCCTENQRRLDDHNAEYDHWQSLSDAQRAAAIKRAIG